MKSEILCLKGKPRLVGRGMYREVYRLGKMVIKLERNERSEQASLHARAVKADNRNKKLSDELNFLPKYYGAALVGVRSGKKVRPALATFHEYIAPLPVFSPQNIKPILLLLFEAGEKGHILDIKPGNFGRKGKKLYYLDEYGVGKSPIPPDVMEEFSTFLQSALKMLRLDRLSRKR
ncbi:MAG: hypothetical protein AB1305_05830 [Candidatus Hadarchaeota archaeon]